MRKRIHRIATFVCHTETMVKFVEHEGSRYVRIDPRTIDFSTAASVHKVTDDYAVRVTADEDGIATIIDGHVETVNSAHKGDWRVYNIGHVDPKTIEGYDRMTAEEKVLARAAQVESYILDNATFMAAHINPHPIGKGVLAAPKSDPRPAMTLPFNAVFRASWGSDEFVKAGGFVVKNGKKIYGIEQDAMHRTYGAINQTKPFIETHAAQIYARKPLVPEVLFSPEVAQDYAMASASLRQKE